MGSKAADFLGGLYGARIRPMVKLELLSTGDLLNELERRFDHGCFAGMTIDVIRDERGDWDCTTITRFWGNKLTAWGAAGLSMSSDARVLTDGEAAQLIRMPPARLLRLAREGRVPCVVLPDQEIRFVESDLWGWVQAHRQELQYDREPQRKRDGKGVPDAR